MGKDLPGDSEIVTLEIHADEAELAEKNIRNSEIPGKIHILVGDAKIILPTLKGTFDMVFIDAEKTEYLQYLRLVEDKLLERSNCRCRQRRNICWSMRYYLDYVRSSGNYRSQYFGFGGDGVEVSIKL